MMSTLLRITVKRRISPEIADTCRLLHSPGLSTPHSHTHSLTLTHSLTHCLGLLLYTFFLLRSHSITHNSPLPHSLMFSAPRPCMRRFVQVEAGVPVLLSESEALLHSLTHISLTFSAEQRPRSGCLFVTTSRFVWLAEEKKDDEDEEEGSSECVSECVSERVSDAYDFDVKFIALHAVSRDPASYERPCLYCQVLRHSLTHSLTHCH